MTRRVPLLIASCPGRTVASVRAEVVQAAEAGADAAEVRVDRIPEAMWPQLPDLFPSAVPLLATLRSRSEGGEGPDTAADRAPVLESVARLPFRFLDLERGRDNEWIESPPAGTGTAVTLIVSSHLKESTATSEIRRLLELARPPGAVAKVVLPCSFARLWTDVLPALSPFETYSPFVLHTTGPTGPLLRAWGARLGMYAVFGALPAKPASAEPETVEPSQIPVDRLRSFQAGNSEAPLFAVVGHPVDHSRSPALHSLWMRHEKRNGLYLALDIASGQELADSVGPLVSGGFRGLNVTHPWKQVALGLASRTGPAAESAACANTLTFERDTVSAENTDVAAVRRRLDELRKSGVWNGSHVTVLGGGGAARSALAALASMGASGIVVTRHRDAAESIAREYGAAVGRDGSLEPTQLVIHATPAGREGVPRLELPWADVIGPATHVLDFVYAPAHPFLRVGAERRGATYEDGSRLLVYQAAESYAIWWGVLPSDALQAVALREVMCAA